MKTNLVRQSDGMPPIKVSVLVPAYNDARFLPECLDSILAQDSSDFELLISDDCSTDGTAAIIAHYAARDPRIRWWRNPVNLRQGGNLNLCLREARGEFIKFVFTDDKLLEKSALRQMVNILEQNPTVSLVASASNVIDSQSELIEKRNYFRRSCVLDGKRVILQCLEQNGNIIGEPSLAMFRKRQATRGFDEQFSQGLDLEMWFHLLEQGQFAYIAEPLCAFRRHSAQQTEINRRTGACAGEHLLLIEKHYPQSWLSEMATRQMLFTQVYYLRKHYGRRADSLVAEMMAKLGRNWYAVLWLKHRTIRPLVKLKTRAQKLLWLINHEIKPHSRNPAY